MRAHCGINIYFPTLRFAQIYCAFLNLCVSCLSFQILTPSHYNCFVARIPESMEYGDTYTGISVTFFLNNFGYKNFTLAEKGRYHHPSAVLGSGVLFHLFEPHTIPMTLVPSITAQAGIHLHVKVNVNSINRVPYPYGFCKDDYESPNMSYFGFEFRYTYPMCMSRCQASGIARECSCVDISAGHNLVKGNKTHPFCGILTKNVTELLKQKDCVQFVKRYLSWYCLFDCPTRCHENIYDTEVTQATWPHSAFLDTFYQVYVKGKPFEDEFQSALNGIQESRCFEFNEVRRISVFRENFVKISMDLSEKFSRVFTEKPKYTTAGLISSLGKCAGT